MPAAARSPHVNALAYSITVVCRPGVQPGTQQQAAPPTLMRDLRDFMIQIFGNPVQTEVGITPTGSITAILPGISPKTAEFSVERIAAGSHDRSEAGAVVAKLWSKLLTVVPGMTIIAYGINLEIEMETPAENAAAWLAQKFVKNGLKGSQWTPQTANRVAFSIKSKQDLVRNITIEPRAGQPTFIFARINNHFDGPPAWNPTEATLWAADLQGQFDLNKAYLTKALSAERIVPRRPKKRSDPGSAERPSS